MATKTAVKAQMALAEETIEDADLLALLEEHEEGKEAVKQQRKTAKRLKALLPVERTVGKVLRCGRFIITGTVSEGGHEVSFETGPRYRLNIQAEGTRQAERG